MTCKRKGRCTLLLVLCGVVAAVKAELGPLRGTEGSNADEDAAVAFLRRYDVTATRLCHGLMEASWRYSTNVTAHNRRVMLTQQQQWAEFHRASYEEGRQFAWRGFAQAAVRRMMSLVTVLGQAALPPHELSEYAELLQEMKAHYSTARACRYEPPEDAPQALQDLELPRDFDYYDLEAEANKSCLPVLNLEPELTQIMATSRSSRELRHAWRAWRDAAGAPLRPMYQRFVGLANKAAVMNGFSDAGDYWRSKYEVTDLEQDLEELWEQLRPLYVLLHSFVRGKLRQHYGESIVPLNGPIPAHLLGNMWSQDWSAILDIALPFPSRAPYNITAQMRRQGFTPLRMFRLADNFYRSLGLDPMPLSFWRDSMLHRPRGRDVVCHASAWDMCNGRDYRVKMCTDVTMEDFIKVHHELGHIQYDMLYKNQPFLFRDGANPGFHEAVGDVIALSAATPRHMRALGLLPDAAFADDQHRQETDLNHLFGVAVSKVAFLPFALVLDKWRWRVFSGAITPDTYNEEWWRLRVQYSGVAPPVERSERDFDPGAKYHVPANTPYVRYLVSFVLQFQLHEEMCKAAGHEGPLHACSIYGSQQAGELLRRGLSLGRSEPWPTVLSQLTAGRYSRLDAGAILRYFQPLHEWLQQNNQGQQLGWNPTEALVAGKSSNKSSQAATAAYVIIALLFLTLLLVTACLLARRWKKTKEANSNESPAASGSSS